MATINSDTYTLQTASIETSQVPNNYRLGKPVVMYTAKIACGTSFDAAADTANLFIVPAGMLPVPELSSVTCDDFGTTFTVDIGTSDDADCYADGISLAAAGSVAFSGGAQAIAPVATTEATTVIATVATVDTPTTGADATVKMAFVKI